MQSPINSRVLSSESLYRMHVKIRPHLIHGLHFLTFTLGQRGVDSGHKERPRDNMPLSTPHVQG